jgi:hypothetical protein
MQKETSILHLRKNMILILEGGKLYTKTIYFYF